jgi:hypothetical protein
MTEEDVGRFGAGCNGDIVWSPSKHVRFTFGTLLLEGSTTLASDRESYEVVRRKLGRVAATGGHAYLGGVSYDYYVAGT